MPVIELKKVSNQVCQDVNLKIFDKELLVLMGPNGAGKTTLLNVIAGLINYNGSVLFDGICMDGVRAAKRNIGYLFQNLVLFPHLDVASNIAYGLRTRKMPPSQVKARVNEIIRMMKIEGLSSRYPRYLSYGEKQRVALARALALSPKVLLLDEPMSNIDFKTAINLRVELKLLQRMLGITTIYVTHNLEEAKELADRVCVIEDGSIKMVVDLKNMICLKDLALTL